MQETVNIYSLVDPRNGLVSYVGKTKCDLEKRLKEHVREINKADKGNSIKNKWMQSLVLNGLKPSIELIDSVPACDWQFWEKHYIKMFKACGAKLYNGTLGGENYCSDDVVLKRSQKVKGIKRSADTLKKMSEAVKGRILSPLGTKKIIDHSILKRKPVSQFDKKGVFIRDFDSISETGFVKSNITLCCLGKRKTANGFIWKFKKQKS